MTPSDPTHAVGIAGFDEVDESSRAASTTANAPGIREFAHLADLLRPLLFVARPKCLEGADELDHRLVAAARHEFLVKLAGVLGEEDVVIAGALQGHSMEGAKPRRHG